MTREKAYATLVGLCLGLFLLYFLYEWNWVLYVIPAILAISILWGWLAKKIAWLWIKLGDGLGWINSRILLGAIFFVVLTPLALLRRLFTKDGLKLKSGHESTFSIREHTFEKKDLENPW